MSKNTHVWSNRLCLVTGAYGFVGTHLCVELLSRGASVVALDWLPDVQGTFFGLLGLDKRCSLLTADVRRPDDLDALRDRSFDAVFHLAAQPISPLSNEDPELTLTTNVEGTANVGRVVGEGTRQPVFVFAPSACWYGATQTSPLTEEDPYVEGEFTYSESKVRAEKEVLKFESEFDMPTVTCRFVNLYGPGDRHFSRLVPKTIRSLLNGDPPQLARNNGRTILDFMYVEDAVSALITAAEHGPDVRGEVFNFGNFEVGGDDPMPAIDVVELTCELFDGQKRTPEILNPVEPRTKAKYLDSTKARKRFGWKPTAKLPVGLKQTIDWYRQNCNRIDHLR